MPQSRQTHRLIIGLACTLGGLAVLARPSISLPASAHRHLPATSAVKTGTALIDKASRTLSKLRNELPSLRSRPLLP